MADGGFEVVEPRRLAGCVQRDGHGVDGVGPVVAVPNVRAVAGGAACPALSMTVGGPRPVVVHVGLGEIDRLVVLDPAPPPILAGGVAEPFLEAFQAVELAVVESQRVAQQARHHRQGRVRLNLALVVDDGSAEAHQRRVEAKKESIHYAVWIWLAVHSARAGTVVVSSTLR